MLPDRISKKQHHFVCHLSESVFFIEVLAHTGGIEHKFAATASDRFFSDLIQKKSCIAFAPELFYGKHIGDVTKIPFRIGIGGWVPFNAETAACSRFSVIKEQKGTE